MTLGLLIFLLGLLLGVIIGLALDDAFDLWRSTRKGESHER